MVFKVELVRPEDLDEFISVIFRAHQGKSHWINSAYPDNLTKEGQKSALEKLQQFTSTAEHSVWEKATDTTTGEIVGAAIWHIFETQKPAQRPTSKRSNMTERDEYMLALNASVNKTEAPFWENNPLALASLTALTVPPEHQYRGIGTLLMESGLKRVDNIGAKVSVVAFDAARWLYEKLGFKVEQHLALEVPEKFHAEEKIRIFFMVRERQPSV